MTADELSAFVTQVRTEVDGILDRLSSLDPTTLPPETRAMYDDVRQQALELRTMTEAHVVALLEAACAEAGRELTPAELRGLLGFAIGHPASRSLVCSTHRCPEPLHFLWKCSSVASAQLRSKMTQMSRRAPQFAQPR